MKSYLLALGIAATLVATPAAHAAAPAPSPSVAPSPAATATPDAMMARAEEWLTRIQTGDIDRLQLTQQMNQILTDSVVNRIRAQFAPLGDPISFTYVEQDAVGTSTAYVYRVVFKTVTLDEVISIDAGGKVSAIHFPTAQQ